MKVLIGVDPHKASLAVAAVDEAEGELLERAGFPQDRAGLSVLERWARRFPERRWAVENAGGLGRHLAGRLAAAGESVVDGSCAWARSEVATESDAVAAPPRARRKEWIGFGVIAVPSLPLLDGSHRIGRRRSPCSAPGIAGATLALSALSPTFSIFHDPQRRRFAVGTWVAGYSGGGQWGGRTGWSANPTHDTFEKVESLRSERPCANVAR